MTPTSGREPVRRDIAADITNKILAELDRGVMPWRKPWDAARVAGPPLLPRRASGENYRGVNVILLWSAAVGAGYTAPTWLSFRQAMKLGGHVRKGERGVTVIYYGRASRTTTDAAGVQTEDPFRFLKSYTVFNVDQIDGLPADYHPHPTDTTPSFESVAAFEAWFAKLDIARIRTRDIACYIPSRDAIGMPPLAAFDTRDDWMATLAHEAIHATMAPHRCDRDFSPRYGPEALAMEELLAETGAAILGAHLGVAPSHLTDHAAYIGDWLRVLKNDKRAFLTAAARAQTAVDWLLAKTPPAARADTTEEIRHVAA